jgi:hypothetical protein
MGEGVSTSKHASSYSFFSYPGEKATVGIVVDGPYVTIYIPSTGGSTSGHRNTGRSAFVKKLFAELKAAKLKGYVFGCRAGRGDTPIQSIEKPLAGKGLASLAQAYKAGGNFRFDFWLRVASAQSTSAFARTLKLEPASEPAKSPEVLWPAAKQDHQRSRGKNAWLVAESEPRSTYSVTLPIGLDGVSGLREGDLVLVARNASVTHIGRVYRRRGTRTETTLYFDGVQRLKSPQPLGELSLSLDPDKHLRRLDLETFEAACERALGRSLGELSRIEGKSKGEQAYLRELIELAAIDDLLGPANSPEEEIVGMGVRDRYLVGKLAPRKPVEEGAEQLVLEFSEDGAAGVEVETSGDGELPGDARPFAEEKNLAGKPAARRHTPGEEFSEAAADGDPDDDSSPEIAASKNQSFAPSSIGLTFCIDAEVEELEVEARWGQYARVPNDQHDHVREYRRLNKETKEYETVIVKERVFRRMPCGGKLQLRVDEGVIAPLAPDPSRPRILLQGRSRKPLPSGDRLITLFLVNAQPAPERNQDEAWIFQPEIIVRHPKGQGVFRRRPELESDADSTQLAQAYPEEAALKMLYRCRLEFASGHSISVRATPAPDSYERACEVRTVVVPSHDVPVTETPGRKDADRAAMRKMVMMGFLDMEKLATLERPQLLTALAVLTKDYAAWIDEQEARIPGELADHAPAATAAVARCREVSKRLDEALKVLGKSDKALQAFRFANRAMARQRIHSIWALLRRRKQKVTLDNLDQPKNRSWRPFQLAFLLLNIPALTDPTHADRTSAVSSTADLIWFPTGGGKTEAYLGVAAFTMAMRRLDHKLGNPDGSRGLSVIMRYTLRLLTMQQFQRASTLICAMECLRREDEEQQEGVGKPSTYGSTPFTIGLWVGSKVSPNSTRSSADAVFALKNGKMPKDSGSPAQLTSCPWCGSEVDPANDIEVHTYEKGEGRTIIYCGDKRGECEFSRAKSEYGLPVLVVDEEIYRRPPTMMIATVDKFAMLAWKAETRTLFGRANHECPRHGLLWPGAPCTEGHQKKGKLRAVATKTIAPIRPPDLIIQDEFHLISGPLGTMVGLYETAIDELSTWQLNGHTVRPKVIASTATVRKATEQVNNVFLRRVAVFPPHGVDIEDNFFSVQRPIEEEPGRRYVGICSPGSSRPAILIRLYTALLTAAQSAYDHFGRAVDPWMTVVGYFNSLRELGGMKRLAEDDVQTRCYRVDKSAVQRPGLTQRDLRKVDELTSRVSGRDIPKKLDELEVPFEPSWDPLAGRWRTTLKKGETRPVDVVLATNMLSVGVDVNRIGLMAVNGQPKNTAEYIQATSRVGRAFPGLVFTVLTWSRPRDLSHYETFEHYHATFYKHVEAQSVTPFAPRALDRGLTGMMVSYLRVAHQELSPNLGASEMTTTDRAEVAETKKLAAGRAYGVSDSKEVKGLVEDMIAARYDKWVEEAIQGNRRLGYARGRARKKGQDDVAGLLEVPGTRPWGNFTVPMSMREVEANTRLILVDAKEHAAPEWTPVPEQDPSTPRGEA